MTNTPSKNEQTLRSNFLQARHPKGERNISLRSVRALHHAQLNAFGQPLVTASWAEWDHPMERSQNVLDFFEIARAYRWAEYIRPGSVCIDIGAHSGDTAIPMAFLASAHASQPNSGHIYAIEPNPDVFTVLEINAAINANLAHITPLRAAIGKADFEEIVISDHGNANCNGGMIDASYSETLRNTLLAAKKFEFSAISLRLETLVSWLTPTERSRLDFIKIDCEGYDKEILRSASSLLQQIRPAIQIEWFDWFTPADTTDLFDAIASIGYFAYNPITRERADRGIKIPDLMLLPS